MKTKTRPHTWKVQGEVPHQQYRCWIQHRNQANFRGEEYTLTFEDYQHLWREHWDVKGRTSGSYCLNRPDPDLGWHLDNVECVPREEHLKRQRLYKARKKNDC